MRYILRRLYDDRIILITGSKQRIESAQALLKANGRLTYVETQVQAA